jgi:hypothetical protein
MGFLVPKTSAPALPDIPDPSAPAKAPIGSRPSKAPMSPSFLGSGTVPMLSGNIGGKTLLGQ